MQRIIIVTDAWAPQINGVVRTLIATCAELRQMGYEVEIIEPSQFRTVPLPSYPEIRCAVLPYSSLAQKLAQMGTFALHIATEGSLGQAARRWAKRHSHPYTTAYHTRFPEYVYARWRVPLSWTYAYLRWFHKNSAAVLAPTPQVVTQLHIRGITQAVLWSRGVDVNVFYPRPELESYAPSPAFLYVGRIAVEKNIEAFLQLPLEGSKWVVGDGPQLATLRQNYPQVHFLGALSGEALAQAYCRADVFVFPSKTDTFGLVMLEAMACGLPVAAYPVEGPLDVIGDSGAGAMDEDLLTACLLAKDIPTDYAKARAAQFTWRQCTLDFVRYLQWECPV